MDLIFETTMNGYLFTTDRNKMDIDGIHDFLCHQSYWATGILLKTVRTSIENSWCFGVFEGNKQVGFARLVTDYATFGYLADVFVIESHRGKGLSKQLMEFIMATNTVKGLRRLMLATRDAHGLYEKFGFEPVREPERLMQTPLKNNRSPEENKSCDRS